MAHAHVSNTNRIWFVFGLLSVVTIVEVALGIFKPEVLYMRNLLSMNLLNWIFIYGLGWGIAGYCPGPALAGLGVGSTEALWFVPSMLAGLLLYRLVNRT